jgi:hypothetical protein
MSTPSSSVTAVLSSTLLMLMLQRRHNYRLRCDLINVGRRTFLSSCRRIVDSSPLPVAFTDEVRLSMTSHPAAANVLGSVAQGSSQLVRQQRQRRRHCRRPQQSRDSVLIRVDGLFCVVCSARAEFQHSLRGGCVIDLV